MPQYMHSDQSMAKRSRTWVVRGRSPGCSAAATSECESMLMHQVGHSRAQTMQEVQAGSIILSHDAGGDRSGTLAAYEILVPELKQKFQLTAL